MTPIKDHIARQFINNRYHFKCDCIIPLDITGIVTGYEVVGNEIVLLVNSNNKTLHIGLNTSSLHIESL